VLVKAEREKLCQDERRGAGEYAHIVISFACSIIKLRSSGESGGGEATRWIEAESSMQVDHDNNMMR
jgi:hypothetical protein